MIKIAKLISGEFVVGNQLDMHLTNVMLVRFDIDRKTGMVNTSFIPYMAPLLNSVAKIITVDKIMASDDAPSEIQQQYFKTISSFVSNQKGESNGQDNSGSNAVSRNDKDTTEESVL